MRKIKLMSPAGSMESLQAAINNGADAVYLGIKNFNARRRNKNNFTIETLKIAVNLAHFHGVEVYCTLNTLVKNKELNLWFKTLDAVYQTGVDAVIIQDLFLLPIVKSHYPDLKIHISTQSSIMNLEGLKNWQDFANLAVLSRELRFEEVKKISKESKIPVEVFCHGHQCISYSGQCLISSLIGKRSGNRGLCASSCRKEYNKKGFLLSPKDMSMLNIVPKLIASGVHTIKIEGRMKSAQYVGVVTKYYRQAIDNYYCGVDKKISVQEINNIKMGFNRDFTTGFFDGNDYKEILTTTLPTHRGIPLGIIKNKKLVLKHELYLHDGVGFWDQKRKKMEGDFVNKIINENGKKVSYAKKGEVITIPNRNFKENCLVYLTSKSGGVSFVGQNKKYKIVLKIINCALNEKLVLRTEFRGKKVTFTSKNNLVLAKNNPLTKEILLENINKNKFFNVECYHNINAEFFLPISDLTTIRNELEEAFLIDSKKSSQCPILKENLIRNYQKDNDLSKKMLCGRVDSFNLIEKVAPFLDVLYYDVLKADFKKAKNLARKINPNIKVFAYTPLVLNDVQISKIVKTIQGLEPDGVLISNQGLLNIKEKVSFPIEVHSSYTFNVFNDLDVAFLKNKNITPTLSIELNFEELKDFKDKNCLLYVHGRPTVMNFKGGRDEEKLVDGKRYSFPLLISSTNNTEMLYSKKIALLDKTIQLKKTGFNRFYLEFFELDYKKDFSLLNEEMKVYHNILLGKKFGDISLLKRNTTTGNFYNGVM